MQFNPTSSLPLFTVRLTRKGLLICLLFATCVYCCPAQQAVEGTPPRAFQRTQAALDRVAEQVEALDAPALRVFLRLRLAAFFWANDFVNSASRAETMCLAAFADLQKHQAEISEADLVSFRREILSALELHSPDAAARLVKQYNLKPMSVAEKLSAASSLLDGKGGGTAVDKFRQILNSGQDTGPAIFFYLDRLKLERPAEVPELLSNLLAVEEQNTGSISPQNLFFLIHLYISKETPLILQERFLRACVKSTGNSSAWSEPNRFKAAYELMRALMPEIEKRLPALYSQASAQLSALAARLPDLTIELEYEALNNRIERSADPLSQTLTEAEATKDSALKNDLLRDAAQLALKKGQLKLAVDVVMRIESSWTRHLAWREQFLRAVVDSALKQKDAAAASYAIVRIDSPLNRARAMQKVAVYFFKAGDSLSASQQLNAAVKLIDSAENRTGKAIVLLEIIPAFLLIDKQMASEVASAAIKAINNIRQPEDSADSEARKNYIETLILIGHAIIPTFESLSQIDEIGALGLANDLQRQEVKAAAMMGIVGGLHKLENGAVSKAQ